MEFERGETASFGLKPLCRWWFYLLEKDPREGEREREKKEGETYRETETETEGGERRREENHQGSATEKSLLEGAQALELERSGFKSRFCHFPALRL